MAAPSAYPHWSVTLSYETKTINGLTVSLPNRATISTDFQQTGVLYGEDLDRQYLNQQCYLTGQWVEFLDKRYSIGDAHLTKSAETAAQIGDRLGGTWVQRGNLTDSASNVFKVFEKTA